MQKKGLIRHPESAIYSIYYAWQLLATDNDVNASEMISLFEYHLRNRYANKFYNELYQKQLRGKDVPDLKGFMPYTIPYIKECLFALRHRSLFERGLKTLEKIGFVTTDAPIEVKNLNLNWSWIKLNVAVINDWINTNYPSNDIEPIIEKPIVKTEEPKEQSVAKLLFEYWQYVHNRNKASFDSKRKTAIEKGLKLKSVGQCVQVILGCLKSEWHQGKTQQNNKVFDGIDLLFRDAQKMEQFIDHAEKAKITEDVAFADFTAWRLDGCGNYTKTPKKVNIDALLSEAKGILSNTQTYSETDKSFYRKFAELIAKFFAVGMNSKMILSRTIGDESFSEYRTIVIEELLMSEILQSITEYCEPNASQKSEIELFTKQFTKLNKLNRK